MSFDFDLFGEDKAPKRKRLTKAEKGKILKRQKDCCNICKAKFGPRSVIQWDHKKALALGGSDTPRNIQALCPNCHAKKTRQDRDKIAKSNKKSKKKDDPFSFDVPDPFAKPKRGRKKKDPFDIF